MNIILLIFVILAVAFMASSANNLITVSTAPDHYLEKAGIPDYWFATMNTSTLVLSGLGGIKIFDKNNKEITHINDGEIYVPNFIFVSPENDFHGGIVDRRQRSLMKKYTPPAGEAFLSGGAA